MGVGVGMGLFAAALIYIMENQETPLKVVEEIKCII